MKVFNIVAVKDELTGSFLQPTFLESKEEGIRLFAYQVNSIKLWKANASDFSLFHLGTYDTETGTVVGITPVKIANGRSVVKEEADDIQPAE